MPDPTHDAAPNPASARRPASGRTSYVQDAEPTDEELDAFILTRLEMLGVDLSVLPEDDPDAPADRRRILASARSFLRTTPAGIANYALDALGPPPLLYPSAGAAHGGGAFRPDPAR